MDPLAGLVLLVIAMVLAFFCGVLYASPGKPSPAKPPAPPIEPPPWPATVPAAPADDSQPGGVWSAEAMGAEAYLDGVPVTACPHPPGTAKAVAWRSGWCRAEATDPRRSLL